MLEKCFQTEDPGEADALDLALEEAGIECQIETRERDSGFLAYTFYVESKDLEGALTSARIVRARQLSGHHSTIDTLADAQQVILDDRMAKEKHLDNLGMGGASAVLKRFRYALVVAMLPVFIPVASAIQAILPDSVESQFHTVIFARILAFGVISLFIFALLRLTRDSKSET